MTVLSGGASIETRGDNHVVDITDLMRKWLRSHDVEAGNLVVWAPHTTVAITALEFEPGANRDLAELCERLIPSSHDYHHNVMDTNGHAHARAALIGPSVSVPVLRGELALGTWQSIALIDFDDRPRTRQLIFQLTF